MVAVFSLTSTTLLALASTASAFVKLPVLRNDPGNPPLVRRGAFEQNMINNLTGGGYYAQVGLGTPQQNVTLIVDTGSSDVWVLDKDADLCTDPRLQSQNWGGCIETSAAVATVEDNGFGATFDDKSKSTTYALVTSNSFEIAYLSGEGASGDYIKEDFHVGGTIIEGLQMGLAESSDINSGLMGVGFGSSVSASKVYPNIMDEFADQGLIETMGYSLWLNDLSSDTGSILFGAIDTEKFIGSIDVVPIVPTVDGEYSHFFVAMTKFVIDSPSGEFDDIVITRAELPVVLDSGTTLSYLPSSITDVLYEQINAYDDTSRTGLVYVSCSVIDTYPDLRFTFSFADTESRSAAQISVPAREIVMDNIAFYESLGLRVPGDIPLSDGDVCSLGIHAIDGDGAASGGGTVLTDVGILGDTFLRSAYVIYDLDNKEIGLAQANLNATDSNIVEMTSGIPTDATGVSSQAPYTQTSGDSATTDSTGGVSTVTITQAAKSDEESAASSLDLGGSLRGGIVGVAVLGWMAVGGLMVLL
ncbi:acid protease [Zalerion maritima]|uniref:Acid protease n=1 Tax=Zalerion maritima TaxID=339359 RepID=A0AAD5WPC8_9PEZI|nr:acid protease [Zalerion maritima]